MDETKQAEIKRWIFDLMNQMAEAITQRLLERLHEDPLLLDEILDRQAEE